MKITLQTALRMFVVLPVLASFASESAAQAPWSADAQWEAIRAKHRARQIHDTVYLAQAQALTESSFKNPALKNKLEEYRTVAWSNPAYGQYRVKYYAFLANHTTLLHQDGYSLYYLQKMEEELKKIPPYTNSLNQPRFLLSIYGERGNFNLDKRVAIIDSITPFLKKLPAQVAKTQVNINTCINAFSILKHAANLYATNKDSVKALPVRDNARALWQALSRKKNLDPGKLAQCQLSFLMIESDAAKASGKRQTQADYSYAAYGIIVSKDTAISALFRQRFASTVLARLIDYQIQVNQLDSAQYFLGLYRAATSGPGRDKNVDGDRVLRYTARVMAAKGNFKPAYENILKAYTITDSITAIKTVDIHNNMYAHLVAEQRQEELLAERGNIARRNMFIMGIIMVLILTIAAFFRILRINREKANLRVERLNQLTQIQIAELEAQAGEIQKRFGMDLHDDIAGRLVGLVNYIETELITEDNPQIKDKLSKISEMAHAAYTSTRSKSHEWYSRGVQGDKTLFSDRVRQIVGSALPDGSYEKQIEIDDECLEGMSAGTRIQLLRIIQEVVANILKHAKARRMQLFIYEDDGRLILQIADNGRGFDINGTQQRGLGLASIRKRAEELGGSLEISSSAEGTKFLFNIPGK